jgi:hypothetical protein
MTSMQTILYVYVARIITKWHALLPSFCQGSQTLHFLFFKWPTWQLALTNKISHDHGLALRREEEKWAVEWAVWKACRCGPLRGLG